MFLQNGLNAVFGNFAQGSILVKIRFAHNKEPGSKLSIRGWIVGLQQQVATKALAPTRTLEIIRQVLQNGCPNGAIADMKIGFATPTSNEKVRGKFRFLDVIFRKKGTRRVPQKQGPFVVGVALWCCSGWGRLHQGRTKRPTTTATISTVQVMFCCFVLWFRGLTKKQVPIIR